MGTLGFVGCFVLSGLFVLVVLAGAVGLGTLLTRAKNGLGGGGSSGAPSAPGRDWDGFRGGRSTSD